MRQTNVRPANPLSALRSAIRRSFDLAEKWNVELFRMHDCIIWLVAREVIQMEQYDRDEKLRAFVIAVTKKYYNITV